MINIANIDKRFIYEDEQERYLIGKIGNKDALENMKKGTFWFRHSVFYRWAEINDGDAVLGDKEDNKYSFVRNDRYSNNEIRTTIKLFNEQEDYQRQLSLCKIRIGDDNEIIPLDRKMLQFGSYFSLVDVGQLQNALKKIDSSSKMKPCTYVNYAYFTGECDSFTKKSSHSYQNELRIVISLNEIDKKYADMIEPLQKEANALGKKICDTSLDAAERIHASYKYDELELKINEIKKDIYTPLDLQIECLSEIMDTNEIIIDNTGENKEV